MANRGLSYRGILLGGVDCLKIPSVCYLHTLSRFSLLVLNLFYCFGLVFLKCRSVENNRSETRLGRKSGQSYKHSVKTILGYRSS